MKYVRTLLCLVILGASVSVLGGCTAEEFGEDTDDLVEEVDFDEQ